MSLINEALRKARQAASEHDAKQPGGAFQPAKAYPSRRSGRGGGILAVALAAVAAGVIGAAGAWWVVGRGPTVPTASIDSEAQVIDAPAAATPAGSPIADAERIEPGSTDAQAVQAPMPATAHAADSTEAARADAGPSEIEPAPAEIAADSEPAVLGPNGERIFVLEAELGYASLSLGYIVAREINPFAEINGVEVHVRSEIEGFTVEAIEADRVVLRDAKGLLVLRVP